MANEHETIADIIAEMDRIEICADGEPCLRDYARRFDAAHKREVGDCAKLREALKHIKDRLPHMLQYMRVHWEDANAGGYFDELMLVIDAALAEPVRNCDVGTAKEQKQRYDSYCFSRGCGNCPLFDEEGCNFAWAQMPYEEGGNDGK